MRVQRPGADFERAVHRGNLPGGQQPVVVVFRGNLSPGWLVRPIVGGVVGIAGPPYAHRRIRPIRRELILLVAGILAMIRRDPRDGNGVAELGTDIRRMLGDRRHDF